MRTNIVLDDDLVAEAFRYSDDIRTKKDLIKAALVEYIRSRKVRDLRELKGKIRFAEGYDYKRLRTEP